MVPLIYTVLFLAGLAGLIVMGAMGFMHGPGHHGHGHGHGQAEGHLGHGHGNGGQGHGHGGHGHAHGGHAHAGHGHGHAAGMPGHQDNANADGDEGDGDALGGPSVLLRLMPFLSPLNWFSWLAGAGAAGSLCAIWGIPEPFRALAAVVGALLFNLGVIKPVWNLVFGFASKPAENLEGCLAQVVEATTSFNARGEGLVRVLIDGRGEDVLARLTEPERASAVRVRRGDQLLIEEVEPSTNTCRVSRM